MQFQEKVNTQMNVSLATLLSIRRLLDESNELSRMCFMGNNSARIKNLILYKTTVDSVYNEVSVKLNNGEKKLYYKKRAELFKLPPIIKIRNTSEGRIKVIDIRAFNKKWKQVRKIDLLVRRLANRYQMLLKDAEGDAAHSLK